MSSISSGYSSLNRLTGLASGLDTESMVEALMKAESVRLDRLVQKKTLLTWQQEQYRSITAKLRSFESKWLSYTNPQANMLSAGSFRLCSAASSNASCISVSASPGATEGVVTVSQGLMARAADVRGMTGLTDPLAGTVDVNGVLSLAGKGFTLTIDGVTREVVFSRDYASGSDMLIDLQTLLDQKFGKGRVTAEITVDGYLGFHDDNSTIRINAPATADDALPVLGFTDGQSHRLNLNSTLDALSGELGLTFDGDDELKFTINGVDFAAGKDETLAALINRVNGSGAGVIMRYDAASDGFSIMSRKTGASQYVSISNTGGNLFGGGSAIGIGNGTWYGASAELLVDGQLITSESNTFTSNGITYTLHRDFTAGETQTVTTTLDVDGVYDKIESFVKGYNEIIDMLTVIIKEKRNYNYNPLTDAQKEEMTEDEIAKWEAMAKQGLLRGDMTLQSIVDKMRSAMMAMIPGAAAGDPDLHLSSIGITTGNVDSSGNFDVSGRLHINEAKLREAIAANPDKVTQIFTANSDIAYSRGLDSASRTERFEECGLAQRMRDIMEDLTSSMRNDAGYKGILLEKAGIDGDVSNTNNQLTKEIKQILERIDRTNGYLKKKEAYYWSQFNALENALLRMNSQSNYLSQFTGGGQ